MNRLTLLLIALLAPASLHGQTKVSDTTLRSVKKALIKATEMGEIEGGMLLVDVNGKRILLEIQGFHDLEDQLPFKENSLLRIYSMTKPITSVAAMTLYEAGKFELDDPVANYIPSFANVKVGVVKNEILTRVDPKRPLTIRDLFRHTAGFIYGGDAKGPIQKEYFSRGLNYSHHGMYPPKMSIRKAANALAEVPLMHQPGDRWTYGLSVDILGALIEVWSQESLAQYIDRSVLRPLGMVDTFFDIPKSKLDRFTSCHSWEKNRPRVVDKWNKSQFLTGFEFHSGGGGLVSTIGDFGIFSQMLTNGGEFGGSRILKKKTLQEMFRNQLGQTTQRRFGLGFSIESVKLDHPTKQYAQYGWGGYANTQFKVIPEAKLSMVFMRQTVGQDHQISKRLFEMIRRGTSVN